MGESGHWTLTIPRGSKNLVKIDLCHTVSEINVFLRFTQKLKWASKMVGKRFLGKVAIRLCRYPEGKKNCQNRSLSHRFRDKCVFYVLRRYSKCLPKIGRENDFWGQSPVDCRHPAGKKFHQNRSISHSYRDECIFAFYAEIPVSHQNFLGKVARRLSRYLNYIDIILACSISEIKHVFAFCTEIQDGLQKWRENDFWGNHQ